MECKATKFGVASNKLIVVGDHDTMICANCCFLGAVDEQKMSANFIPSHDNTYDDNCTARWQNLYTVQVSAKQNKDMHIACGLLILRSPDQTSRRSFSERS